MFKNLVLVPFVAVSFGGSILASTTSASAVYYNVDTAYAPALTSSSPSYAVGAMSAVSPKVARPESIIVAEDRGWCYWHPYHCDESD